MSGAQIVQTIAVLVAPTGVLVNAWTATADRRAARMDGRVGVLGAKLQLLTESMRLSLQDVVVVTRKWHREAVNDGVSPDAAHMTHAYWMGARSALRCIEHLLDDEVRAELETKGEALAGTCDPEEAAVYYNEILRAVSAEIGEVSGEMEELVSSQ